MANSESETHILKKLFEETLSSLLERKKDGIELSEKNSQALEATYSYLFLLAYGNNWPNSEDELAQKVERILSELILGD